MDKFSKILICFGIFILGISLGCFIEDNKPKKIITIRNTDTTLVNKVFELEKINSELLDELQLKESEISYWGRKYEEEKNKK